MFVVIIQTTEVGIHYSVIVNFNPINECYDCELMKSTVHKANYLFFSFKCLGCTLLSFRLNLVNIKATLNISKNK